MLLVYVALACGAGYAGRQLILRRRRTHRPLSHTKPYRATSSTPLSTEIYVVQCWRDGPDQGQDSVTRYTLSRAATGERCGYPNADALLEALSSALTKTNYKD